MTSYFEILPRGLMPLLALLACVFTQSARASCDYIISNEWNTGFTAAVRISNNGTVPINGWSISWRYNSDRVTSSWNATVTGANPYSATNVSWNSTINPGQVIEFGVQGTKGGSAAEKPAISGTACNGSASSKPASLSSSSAKSSLVVSSVKSSIAITSSQPSSIKSSSISSSSKSSVASSRSSSFAPAKILLIGDSTVSTYASGYYPRSGWGQLLGLFFKSNVTVDNRAIGGTSSKSFYNNNWAAVKKDIKKGDFVFIQFGINDRNSADPARYAPTDGTFQDYLTRFANDTIAMGGTPVFVSTLVRNSWTAGKVYPAYHDHPIATRNLAAQLKVALIDLDAKSTALLTTVGQAYSTRFYYLNLQVGEYPNYANGNTDDVHFQLGGALEMARLVVEGIEDNKSNPAFAPLVNQLQPRYPLSVSQSVANAGVVTRGFNYPAGATVTLKEIPNGTNKFTAWRIGGNQVSTKAIYETKMLSGGINAQAIFNGVTTAALQKTSSALVGDTDLANVCTNEDTQIDDNGWGWEEDQPCQAQQ